MKIGNFMVGTIIGLTTISVFAQQWTQRGNTISGDNVGDLTGEAVAMNHDGSILVVGLPGFNNQGTVRIYKWNGSNWQQMLASISGNTGGAFMGCSVGIDSIGNTIVVGSRYGLNANNVTSGIVEVYERNGDSWVQKGSAINGSNDIEFFGYSVDISSDGNTVVIGVRQSRGTGASSLMIGRVEVYKWDGSDWVRKGDPIYGDANIDARLGSSVAISSDGNVIAAAAPETTTPYVRVYEWDGSQWVQRGSTLVGDGSSVDLNGDGTVLVVGDANEDYGVVRVYEWNGSSWVMKGGELRGDATNNQEFGMAVSINNKGNVIAVGDPTGNTNGSAFVFRWDGSNWVQVGNTMKGQSGEWEFGRAVALNSVGNMVAIGIPDDVDVTSNVTTKGFVKVFYNNTISNVEKVSEQNEIKVSYNSNDLLIHLSGGARYSKITITIVDIMGRTVLSQQFHNQSVINVSIAELNTGMYSLIITTDNEFLGSFPVYVGTHF